MEEIEETKNGAELLAIIKAVDRLTEPCNLTIYTDSEFVAAGFEQGWIEQWEKNGWITAKGKEVEHQILWQYLQEKTQHCELVFQVKQEHSYSAWMELELKGGKTDV